MSSIKIIIEVKSCYQCPYVSCQEIPDPNKPMEDLELWTCTKKNKNIHEVAPWQVLKEIPIPSWCPQKLQI